LIGYRALCERTCSIVAASKMCITNWKHRALLRVGMALLIVYRAHLIDYRDFSWRRLQVVYHHLHGKILRHVTCVNESFHIWMSHVTYE
jgi:hypothetical protein